METIHNKTKNRSDGNTGPTTKGATRPANGAGISGMADRTLQRVRRNHRRQSLRDDDQDATSDEHSGHGPGTATRRATLLRNNREAANDGVWTRTGRQRETRHYLRTGGFTESRHNRVRDWLANIIRELEGATVFLEREVSPPIRQAKRKNGLDVQRREEPRVRLHRSGDLDRMGTKRRRSRSPTRRPTKKSQKPQKTQKERSMET